MIDTMVKQYIVDGKGNPTDVILSIGNYKKILAVLKDAENQKESFVLSHSEEFVRLVRKGLEDIRAGRIVSWREVWDEL